MPKAKATPKLISGLFYASHGILAVLAVGFSLCAYFTEKAEKDTLQDFGLTVSSKSNVKVCYATSGCLLIAAGFGILAQLRGNKACFWILYCAILGFLSLALLAEGVGALGKASNNMKSVETELRNNVIEQYFRDPNFHDRTVAKENRTDKRTAKSKAWDATQVKYKCCGLNNYTDWQSVSFGRTSLTVPISCCIESRRSDEWCGINVLPVLKNPKEKINPEGCFLKLIKEIKFQLQIIGYFSILVSLFVMGLVGTVSYLMVTKKM